ncbi:hypothetical protein U746_2798 [Mycolicibacterium mucogenicum 261Sha1.1M5]|nr:hypothetical protein U746_2798 [Mycolicibacterium mucogenicum 261Sha1.1M5]
MHENSTLSNEARTAKRLSSLLLDVSAAARRCLPRDESIDTDSSRLIALYTDAQSENAEVHVAQSLRYAKRSFLSACDHTRAFAILLRHSEPPGPSLVTLARGAFEAAARSAWLIGAGPLDEHLHRFLSIRWDDLKFASRFESSVEGPEGNALDPNDLRAEFESERLRLELPKLTSTSNSKLVQEFLDTAIPFQDARKNYSVYSAVAHGELAALDSLVPNGDDDPDASFQVPVPALTSLAWGQALAILELGYRLSRWIGGSGVPTDRLDGAKVRLAAALDTLPPEATAPSL